MASCPVGEMTTRHCKGCIHELIRAALYEAKIMPQPGWCQEAAMVGKLIDHEREQRS